MDGWVDGWVSGQMNRTMVITQVQRSPGELTYVLFALLITGSDHYQTN